VATAALIAAAFCLTGCCPLIPAGDAREVWVREGQEGREVPVRVGQIIVVDLEAAPTTGYRWEVEGADAAILRQVGEPEFESKSPLLMGAPAQQRTRLEIIGPGECTLTLVYRRPWETGKPPLKSYSVRLTATSR
jgi:predicted secreted protein